MAKLAATGAETQHRAPQDGAWYNGVICIGAALALVAIFLVPTIQPTLLRAEHWAADWRTAWLSERLPRTHPKVAVVAVTERSVAQFPYFVPINRGYVADIVDAVDKAGARAIGLDFYFTRDTEPGPDAKLSETLRRLKHKVVAGVYEDVVEAQRNYQYQFLGDTPAGHINLAVDPDHVIRYRAEARDDARYKESFSTLLARAGGWKGGELPDRIGWLLPPLNGEPTFPTIEAHRLLAASPAEREELLKDRIVLIAGTLYTLDRHWTPLSLRSRDQAFGVYLHAQMVAELIDGDRSYEELGPIATNVLLFALALLGVVLGLRFQERRYDFLDWRVVSLAVIAADLLAFRHFHLVVPFTMCAAAWVAAVTTGTHLRRAYSWGRRKRVRRSGSDAVAQRRSEG
jgi:CHASE2 domain-containing sensor protein